MDLPRFHQLSTASKISVFGVAVLLIGLFVVVNSSLQQQDNRSKASSATNFITNPGCESSTTGFKGYQATLSVSSSVSHSGSTSCLVKYNSGSFYDIESTNVPSNPIQGQQYAGAAYVRSDTSIGKPVYLAMRENGGSSSSRTVYGPAVYLSSQWQLVTNTITIQGSGRTSLSFYIVQEQASSGNAFYADDMIFQVGSSIAQPTDTPMPTLAPIATLIPTATPTPIQSGPTPTQIVSVPTVTPTKTPTPTQCVQPTAPLCPNGTLQQVTPTAPLCVQFTCVPYTPTPTVGPTNTPVPTATPVPGATLFNLTLALHGLGNGGDSVNPSSVGNIDPSHPQKQATIEVYDNQNQLVTTKQGTVIFDVPSGLFKGTIDMGTLPNGLYLAKVKIPQYLRTGINGIQNITSGTTNNLPKTTLVTGDINGDNTINILDYNLLMGCYSDFLPPVSCSTTYATLSDLTDDGAVNQFDYNLFLRELTSIEGQ